MRCHHNVKTCSHVCRQFYSRQLDTEYRAKTINRRREMGRAWYAKNKDKILARRKPLCVTPEYRKKHREYEAMRRAANPDRAREQRRKHHVLNWDKERRQHNVWAAANRDKTREHARSPAERQKRRQMQARWKAKDPQRFMEYRDRQNKYRRENPEYRKKAQARTKAYYMKMSAALQACRELGIL